MLTLFTALLDQHGSGPAHATPASTKPSGFIRVYAPGETEATECLSGLLAGNRRFAAEQAKGPHRNASTRQKVAKKQTPFASVLTCADSRLSPELIFDQGLGDLFVVRVAGNLVDVFGIASLEYAAEHLGSKVILVLGHERCGAVGAACDYFKANVSASIGHDHSKPESHESSIPALVEALQPAVEIAWQTAPQQLLEKAITVNAQRNAEAVVTQSPLLKAMVAKGEVVVVSGVYDLDTGKVTLLTKR